MSKFLEVRKMTQKRVTLVIRIPTDDEVPDLPDVVHLVGWRASVAVWLTSEGNPECRMEAHSTRAPGCVVRDVNSLTEREHEIAHWLAAGASNKKIAEALRISRTTVETHVKRIRTKLTIRGRGWVKSVLSELSEIPRLGIDTNQRSHKHSRFLRARYCRALFL